MWKNFYIFLIVHLIVFSSCYIVFKKPIAGSRAIANNKGKYHPAVIKINDNIIPLSDYYEEHIFGQTSSSLDSIIRNFFELMHASKNSEWARGEAEDRYIKIAEKLKLVSYALSTASVQASGYAPDDNKLLVKAIESYYSALYVLAWHHAHLFHRGRLPTQSSKETCIDFTKILTWDAINGCRLVLEKEFALIANNSLAGELSTLSINAATLKVFPVVAYIQKNFSTIRSFVALARLGISNEIKNFIEFNALKDWKDPYLYSKFLTFNALRESMINYWAIDRYHQSPIVLKQVVRNSNFLLTNISHGDSVATNFPDDWLTDNNYVKELFHRDFFYNALNSYTLKNTSNKNEVIVTNSIWGEMHQEDSLIGKQMIDDGRICKKESGCQARDGIDLYAVIFKSIYGSEKSCVTKFGSRQFSCNKKLHNYFYQKDDFWFVSASKESDIDEVLFTEEIKRKIQEQVRSFIKKNPGLISNSILPGEDLSSILKVLRHGIDYRELTIGQRIISPVIQAKTLIIANAIHAAIGVEEMNWYNPLDPINKSTTLTKDEKYQIYQTVYCRTAEVLWGVKPKDLQSELIDCGSENSQVDSTYFKLVSAQINKEIFSKYNQRNFSLKNSKEKVNELLFYANLIDAPKVANHLSQGENSKIKLRPFDKESLKIYANIMTGNLGNSQVLLSYLKHIYLYMERSGFLDKAYSEIEKKYNIDAKKILELKNLVNPILPTGDREKLLRRSVKKTIYIELAKKMESLPQGTQEKIIEAINSSNPLPEVFLSSLKDKLRDYFYYHNDRVRNFKCEKEQHTPVNAFQFKKAISDLDRETMTKVNLLKEMNTSKIVANTAHYEGSWARNYEKLINSAGQWKDPKKCAQPPEFSENGFDWLILGRALGVFEYKIAKDSEFIVTTFDEEPKINNYNEHHARYVYYLMQRRFPFLSLPQTENWYGQSFLNLKTLPTVGSPGEEEWKANQGIKLVQDNLALAWKDYSGNNQGIDLLNTYSQITFSSKSQFGFSGDERRFKILFERYLDFRLKFTTFNATRDNITQDGIMDTVKFLEDQEQYLEWVKDSADEKIKDYFHPWMNIWDDYIKPNLTWIITASLILTGWGILAKGFGYLGVELLILLTTIDSVGFAILLTDSAYNLIYKNNIELPNMIASQSKVATAFSFYSDKSLHLNNSSFLVKLDQAADAVEIRNRAPEVLADQVWSQEMNHQSFKRVSDSKEHLSSKWSADFTDLGLTTLLYFIPAGMQIKQNILMLKNGRTYQQVMRAAGLPYMNLPQRVRYFFSNAPEVEQLFMHLKDRPLKDFYKRVVVAFDPLSQSIKLSKSGVRNLEQQFFLNLLNKENASRETIHLLYRDASKKSLNPKIDIMHQELELYLNFMKTLVREIKKFNPKQMEEFAALMKQGDYAQHSKAVYSKIEKWMKDTGKLDNALADEAESLRKAYGNMPKSQADAAMDISRLSLLHAENGALIDLSLGGSSTFITEKAGLNALNSFLQVEKVLDFYTDMLNLSKLEWYNTSSNYLRNQFKNTLSLEENLLHQMQRSKQIVPHGKIVRDGTGSYVEQLSLMEKIQMEQKLSLAWSMNLSASYESSHLALMMMLRDFQGMHASLVKSPKLADFLRKNLDDSAASISNFFGYVNGRVEAPLYAKLLKNWSSSGNFVKAHSDKLEKLEGASSFIHYIEVPMSSKTFRENGIFSGIKDDVIIHPHEADALDDLLQFIPD
jgi:hypothetical protein